MTDEVAWRRRARRGAVLALLAVIGAPLALGAGVLLPLLLPDLQPLERYLPALPVVLLSLAAAGAIDLAARIRGTTDRTWAIAGLALTLLGAIFSLAYAGALVWRPDGVWAALAAPRLPLALLAGWALSERLGQVLAALGSPRPDSLWEDMGSLTLLLGIPLVLPQVVQGLPSARDLVGGLSRPLMLLLLAGALVGYVRLVGLLLAVARGGDERDL